VASGRPWLWPDPLRRHWYLPLGSLALAAIVVWLVIALWQPVGMTALAGILIPIFTWAVAYGVLAVRPAGAGEVKQWTELCRCYRFAGTLMFVLTAAVPAASFYALSYDRHIEAFTKERQIGLARRINAAVPCNELQNRQEHVARYDDPAHDGEVACVTSADVTNDSAVVAYLHTAFEDWVPYFTSASVALRELMHRKSDDKTWFSHRNGDGALALQLRTDVRSSWLQVTTPLPPAIGWRGTVQGASVVVVAAASLVMLQGVLWAAYLTIAFLLRRVLLADVVEPIPTRLRIVTQVGQHLQIICRDPCWMASRVHDVYLLRLTPAVTGANPIPLDDIRTEVSNAPASQRIGVADLEGPPDDDVRLLEKKLEIVEALMSLPNQTVLLFTRRTARELDAWIRTGCDSSSDRERWLGLIGTLRVTELPAQAVTGALERWKHHFRNLLQGWRDEFISRWQDWRAPLRWRARLLEREGQSDPTIDGIATELQKSPAFESGSLTHDQILEEIEDRADQHYREIWEGCSEDERVLLEHVAQHGLASAASRRVVRRSLATGLLRKDPEMRLMSESFRRFVLEPERRNEVAALEQQAVPSLWDRLRVPLAMSGTLALLFLVVTQREALDTTVSMAVGVTTAVPTLVKLTSLLAQLGVKSDQKANV